VAVLFALAWCSVAAGVDSDYGDLQGNALVEPLSGELGEGVSTRQEPADDSSEGTPAAMSNLEKDMDDATSVSQVKSSMTNSIKSAMAQKKADLLAKASKAADEKTEKAAEAKAEKEAQIDIENQENKAEVRAGERKADERSAKAKYAKAEMETDHAKEELTRVEKGKNLVFQRSAAEEKAKTATADRIAAEEKAKAAAAQRVASEEDARKAAAMRLTQEEQARAAQKSPMELHAMEAKAFQQAAALKVREGEALARVAALKNGDNLQRREDQEIANEANAKTSLHDAKVKLHHLVEQATAALFQAKAKPFDKAALQQVIHIKGAVSQAKADVVRLAAGLKRDESSVRHFKSEMRSEGNKFHDVHHEEDDEESHESKEEKHDLQHPDLEHMTDEQVKYWANKKMKWRIEDPMNKNKVMSKIFQIKSMEAQTLTKMNELNTRIGMNTTGIRAGLLGKGESVIMDGELVKPDPEFHINHVFQGQKGRDPQTEDSGRDADLDKLKVATEADLHDHIRGIHSKAQDEIDGAIAARTAPYAPAGDSQAAVLTLSDLKKAVQKNSEKGLQTTDDEKDSDEEDTEAAGPGKSLGDANDADTDEDDTSVESLAEQEDDDAVSDDNDVDEVEDEASMGDIAGDTEW